MIKRILFLFLVCSNLLQAQQSTLIIPPFKHSWGIHKGTEKELKLFLGSSSEFDNPQGLAVARLKSTDDPNSESDDDEVTAYGVNSNRGEIIYNVSMYSLGSFRGDGEYSLLNPKGITANSDGLVYVADMENHRVLKLLNDGKKLKFQNPVGQNILSSPFGVALNSKSELYVSDSDLGRVLIFNPDGSYKEDFPYDFIHPTAIIVVDRDERWSHIPDDLLGVIDSFNLRIGLFNYLGEKIGSFNFKQLGLDTASFQYIAMDYYNNVYVTELIKCQIHKFNREFEYLTSIGTCGKDDYQLDEPRGIAIYRKFGQVFVGERKSAQYYWIGTDIKDLKIINEDKQIRIDFILTETSYLSVKLKSKGKPITIKDKEKNKAGFVEIIYPKDFLKSGKYTIEIEAEATYSSYGNYKKLITKEFTID